MGRNKKHKKELRSEKSKIQLKTKLTKTKFLPKGGNVTDVNFKIKPIVIREQLKSSAGDELVTKKKHNLKELLTRLNHYNTTMRFEACEGMMELILSSPSEVVEQSLYIILQGISKLVLDIETKVRQKAIKVLKVILEKVSSLKVSPFFSLLSSYVLCAMTHIDRNIQEDSLLIIDIYLECVPDLIVKDFDKIFANFLTLISKLRNDSKLSRTITVNLSSKLTSIKWRIKVLSRLHNILKVVIQRKNIKSANSICKTIECDSISYIPLYRNVCETIEVVPNEFEGEKKDDTEYIKILLPLLYETWAEAVPLNELKYHENGAMLIDQDAASILSCVIGILHVFVKFLKYSKHENDLRKLFLSKENKLLSHFLNQFPYRQTDYRKKVEKELNKLLTLNTDPKCVEENLLICYVFCVLYKTFPNAYHLQKATDLLKYINVCLSQRNYIPSQSIETMTMVLRIIFFDNLSTWQQKQLISEKLLDNVVSLHNNLPLASEHRMVVFNLLVDIAKEPQIVGSSKFLAWLGELPSLLLKPEISIRFVDSLSLLARQNNKRFLEALLISMPNILYNLPKLKVIDDELPPAHIRLINMFYYIPHLKSRNIEVLKSFVEHYKDWEFCQNVKLLLVKKC